MGFQAENLRVDWSKGYAVVMRRRESTCKRGRRGRLGSVSAQPPPLLDVNAALGSTSATMLFVSTFERQLFVYFCPISLAGNKCLYVNVCLPVTWFNLKRCPSSLIPCLNRVSHLMTRPRPSPSSPFQLLGANVVIYGVLIEFFFFFTWQPRSGCYKY